MPESLLAWFNRYMDDPKKLEARLAGRPVLLYEPPELPEPPAAQIVVPSAAVQTGQQGQFVFVVKEDSTVDMRQVAVARAEGDETVIASGLAAGEQVVTDGQLKLTPGAKVTIARSPGEAPAAQPQQG